MSNSIVSNLLRNNFWEPPLGYFTRSPQSDHPLTCPCYNTLYIIVRLMVSLYLFITRGVAHDMLGQNTVNSVLFIANNTSSYIMGLISCTLRDESSQTNVLLQYKLLASMLSAVCSVIQQS